MSLILVADLAFRVAVFWFDLYHPCGGVALWCDTLLLLRVTLWAQSSPVGMTLFPPCWPWNVGLPSDLVWISITRLQLGWSWPVGPRRPRFPSVGGRYRCGRVPELARQLGWSWPVGPRRPRFPSVGGRYRCGRVPELARQLGWSWPGALGGHGSRALEAGTGAAGCRSWPASWGDHGRWARGALVLDGQQPVAGMGGAQERARQPGGSWPGLRCPDWFAAAVAGVGANMGWNPGTYTLIEHS